MPHALNVLAVVGDIRLLQVQPEADAPGEVVPHIGVAHHGLLARGVVLFDADGLADVLLGDAELFLHAELDGQPVGVPAGLAVHAMPLLRLVAAEDVLDGARHHVVDAGQAVGAGRTLVEHEGRRVLAQLQALAERVLSFPLLQHSFGDLGQVEFIILRKTLVHHGFLRGGKDSQHGRQRSVTTLPQGFPARTAVGHRPGRALVGRVRTVACISVPAPCYGNCSVRTCVGVVPPMLERIGSRSLSSPEYRTTPSRSRSSDR